MEGVERTLRAFSSSSFITNVLQVFQCCINEKQRAKVFKRKVLRVTKGTEPELLLWENYGISSFSRFMRVIMYIVYVIFMLIFCFYIISMLEQASNEASNQVPDIQCPETVDASAANLDYYANFTVRTGDFHCFCKNLYGSKGLEGIQTFQFPLDDQTHCNEWFTQYWVVLATVGAIALLIILGNVVVEVLIKFGAVMTKPVNEQKIIINSVRAISWI